MPFAEVREARDRSGVIPRHRKWIEIFVIVTTVHLQPLITLPTFFNLSAKDWSQRCQRVTGLQLLRESRNTAKSKLRMFK